MMQLVPCDGCARHARADEGACPFCGAAITQAPRVVARRGATRAAIFYLGATLAACGGQSEPPPEATIVQPYGAPPDPDPPEPPPETPDRIDRSAIAAPYGAPPRPEPEVPDGITEGTTEGTSEETVGQPSGAPAPGPEK